ncbi:hypothetical protein DFP72DRAFT_1174376 [Ephemerocybe angulata]|uniref:Uncharacterized protein n=1 Tax=Ephemerocybe angulata TaxID=980116 RepID=A0A8H6HL10_9AGAR|nr:hypothetical protein DFP72DRAFT_1174376 [Tulosesus angulatus]
MSTSGAASLQSATKGFGYLFADDIDSAKAHFAGEDDPFHLMGLGVCTFLEAVLSMETDLIAKASQSLELSESMSRKYTKDRGVGDAKGKAHSRFPKGIEWEILNTDAVVLLSLVKALGGSYMGYVQCLYSMNNAHSKFTKLYKIVFPDGLPETNCRSNDARLDKSETDEAPVEELIVSGTAFGYGLFNLVFSMLPKKVQGLVGMFGFQHDRALALRALALSATKKDVHGVFAGLVLVTYYGDVLLCSGWQADEAYMIDVNRRIVDDVEARYPGGALWILNRAKILRATNDPEAAIKVLQDGLKPKQGGKKGFAQANIMLWFELAWLLLGQRRYAEAAAAFVKMTELNSWSHGTYYFIAAGCYFSIGDMNKAQELLDAIPGLIEKKMGGKDLPTETFIKKKLAFYKEKQARRGGDPARYIEAVKISPAEEMGFFWNTHARIDVATAKAHIAAFAALTPKLLITSPEIEELVPHNVDREAAKLGGSILEATTPLPSAPSSGFFSGWRNPSAAGSSATMTKEKLVDLDNGDDLAVRALLLGIFHKTAESYDAAQAFLSEAARLQESGQVKVNTWVGGMVWFERAVAGIREVESRQGRDLGKGEAFWKGEWEKALKGASMSLEKAMGLNTNSVDMSARLDNRVNMLRDEIAAKRASLGIVGN